MRFLGTVARQFSIGMVVYKNSDQLHLWLFDCINIRSLRDHFEPSASGSNNLFQPLQVIIQC